MATKTLLITTLITLVSCTTITTAKQAELPSFINVCSRNDPNIDQCIQKTVEDLKPYLRNGIPELRVPPMEPLDIGDLTILDGSQGAGFNIRAKKLKIYGPGDFQIKKFASRDGGKQFDFELLLPRLQSEGFYDVAGSLLSLPLKGSGRFNGNFTNFYAFVRIKFEIYKADDTDFIKVGSLDVKIKTGKGRVHLYNLFNGDKVLGDIINETINQNFEAFTTELIPPIERALEKKFFTIASKIMEGFSYDDLFPV